MTLREAVQALVLGVGRECRVLRSPDLRILFPDDTTRAFAKGLGHLVEVGLLDRVMRGVYVNNAAQRAGAREVGLLVDAMRPGCLSYLSYESVLADCGTLSQQPYWYTVATTGRGGEYVTPAGRILFRHTSRPDREIALNTVVDPSYEIMVAHPNVALADLRRVHPNMPFDLDMEAHRDAVGEWAPMRDFLGLADAVIARDAGLAPCRATVEKELLHMEILEALRGIRAFPRLAFKGGTCLRLCRQGKRLSEDLVFAAGRDFDAAVMDDLEGCYATGLPRRMAWRSR